MGSFFPQLINVERPPQGSYVNGKWVQGESVDLGIQGSWQPTKSSELENLPEGQRIGEFYTIFSGTELKPASQDGMTKADVVVKNGERYNVVSSDTWQNSILPHYQMIVQRVNPNANP